MSEIEQTDTGLEEAVNIGMKLAGVHPVTASSYAHDKGIAITDLSDQVRDFNKVNTPGPRNLTADIATTSKESFIKTVKDFREERTRTFADATKRTVKAIFDFAAPEGDPRPGWSQFSARITFDLSRKLREWSTVTDWTSQRAFAEFLEDHLEDVEAPDSSGLLSLCEDFNATLDGHFKSRQNLKDGSVRIDYQSDVVTAVTVPSEILLAIPLFEGGDHFRLKARLRFRVSREDGVVFKIIFSNLEDSLESHFKEMVEEIGAEIEEEITWGSVEVRN